jgi:putative ABC transport system permease protein
MLKLTLKNLAANRVRFTMTTFAVVLAVSFVVSSFVLTDGLRSTFGDLSEEIIDGTDLEVRPVDEFGSPVLVDDTAVATVAAVDGVRVAAPMLEPDENTIRPINADGEEIDSAGPPHLAFGWIDDPDLSSFDVVEGSAPDEPHEFALDIDSASDNGFVVGETYSVLTPTGARQLTLSATTTFGKNNDTLGAILMQFEIDALGEFTDTIGYDSIAVALDDDADASTVSRAIAAAIPDTEVFDKATLESEQKAEFNNGIDIIGNVLLGFAGVSLFVSTFIIYNTFAIVLGQRTREMALLRTVGADPDQLRRSVQGEALAIGVIASAIGILGGIGVAFGLRGMFASIGADLPDSPTIVSARTIIVAALVGIVVTFVSAVGPARKASRVPAIAALREGSDAGDAGTVTRFAMGTGVALTGLVAGGFGLFGGLGTPATVALMAIGAIGIFAAVALLSPAIAGPLTRLLGWPTRRLTGVSGKLAQDNAGRNPRRTATTAAALMIGLALVTMALVVGESVKAQLRSTLASSVDADYLITEDADAGFPAEFATQVAASPVTTGVVAWSFDDVRIAGEIRGATSADHASVAALFDLDITDGAAVADGVSDPVLVSDDEADAMGLRVGDTLRTEFSSGEFRDATVTGIFGDDVIVDDDYLFDSSTWTSAGADTTLSWLAVMVDQHATTAELDAAFAGFGQDYPLAAIETFVDYIDGVEADIDSALTALNAMVALAVVIALIGIANTLALSVFERTRELGLLRAVGMSRRQLRRMVRFEAGLVALFGAVLGVSIGVGFGWAAVVALPAEFTSTLAIPVNRIVALVVVAGVAGLVAAWGPARRAGRLDVLEAIGA